MSKIPALGQFWASLICLGAIKHASNQSNTPQTRGTSALDYRRRPARTIPLDVGHVSGHVGCHCVPCRARFRPRQNPSPNLRSCRIASCERDRLLSKGLGSSNHKNFLGPIGATVFPVPSFQRRSKSGRARQTQIICFGHGSPDRHEAEESRGTAVDDRTTLVPSGGENRCTRPWIRIVSRNGRIQAARRLYQLRGTVKHAAQAARRGSSVSRVQENCTHGLKVVC
jgi:hypothetical protein